MKFVKVIALILISASCSPGIERMEKPSDLIEQEKMTTLLTELMKLEGHVSSKYVNLTKYYKIISNSGDSLIEAHGFTPEQFQKSMDYYAFEQEELRLMYNKVLDNLNKEMVELEKKQSLEIQ